MEKQIKKITNRQFKETFPGLNAVDAFHTDYDFEPFLVFTEFYMSQPVFGPHPHAGISVMTYMLPDSKGSFLNRDSGGDHSLIEPGSIHVTQAGSGIKHDERPTVAGVECHGFQIWINHADKDRLIAPKAFHASAKQVPEHRSDQAWIRMVQGHYKGLQSPIELVTKTTVLDVTLQPNSSLALEAQEMACVYLMTGTLQIGEREIAGTAFVTFEKTGNTVKVVSKDKAAHFIFLSGQPHNEPIVHGGPFVMTTALQLQQTQQRLQRGEMGILNPL